MEPDWQAFGCSKASAMTDVIQLAERLGCRDRSQPPLPQQWAVCLARGAYAVLEAVHLAGGVQKLRLADPAATACLSYGLVQAVGDLRRRWLLTEVRERTEQFFAELGPDMLWYATGDMQKGGPGCAQRTYVAAGLAHAWVTCSDRQREKGNIRDRAVVQFVAATNQVRR